jgi:hypothetical protein
MPRPSTLWSFNVLLPEVDSTLYDLLAVAAPAGVTAGEALTATKETIDNDQEEPIEGDIVTGLLA